MINKPSSRSISNNITTCSKKEQMPVIQARKENKNKDSKPFINYNNDRINGITEIKVSLFIKLAK
jgi:hypothetical protein